MWKWAIVTRLLLSLGDIPKTCGFTPDYVTPSILKKSFSGVTSDPLARYKTELNSLEGLAMDMDALLEKVNDDEEDNEDSLKDKLNRLILQLEHAASKLDVNENDIESSQRFQPLVDQYEVVHVASRSDMIDLDNVSASSKGLTHDSRRRKGRNSSPVGGKWTRSDGLAQKIFQTRRKFQHILPAHENSSDLVNEAIASGRYNCTEYDDFDRPVYEVVAGVVNVISLDAFLQKLRVTIILKGDAVSMSTREREVVASERKTPGGLSANTVRAIFGPPRIVLSHKSKNKEKERIFLSFCLGPVSNVVLDTPYYNKKFRIGKGSAGSRFVFQRCAEDDVEAKEWTTLYDKKPLRKKRILLALGIVFGSGIGLKSLGQRALSYTIIALSSVLGSITLLSSGGIERDDNQ